MDQRKAMEMMQSLKALALETSESVKERRKKTEMVDSLMRIFMRSHVHRRPVQDDRDTVDFVTKSPDANDSGDEEKKSEALKVIDVPDEYYYDSDNNDYVEYSDEEYSDEEYSEEEYSEEEYSEEQYPEGVLIQKVNEHKGEKGTFGHLLNPPSKQKGVSSTPKTKPKESAPPDMSPDYQYEDFSHVLLDKVKQHEGSRDTFANVLEPPSNYSVTEEKRAPLQTIDDSSDYEDTEDYEDFSHVLFNKIKEHDGDRKVISSGLELPIVESVTDRPSLEDNFSKGSLPSVPRSTTPPSSTSLRPASSEEKFTEQLRSTVNKAKLERQIMNMIISDPDTVVDTFSDMFEHTTDNEEEARVELTAMIKRDPMGVAVTFSDLAAKLNQLLGVAPDVEVENEEMFTPDVPHKYEEPPDQVRGQLMRLRKPVRIRVGQSPHSSADPHSSTEPPKMPGQVLETMLQLIDSGVLSHEEIIEEMINNGMLPVAVTEFGKIPITVGTKTNDHRTAAPVRLRPIVPKRMRDAEEISKTRLNELHQQSQRSPITKDTIRTKPPPVMIEVDITDPDGDFEDFAVKEVETESSEDDQRNKEIDAEKSLIELYEQGLITREELEDMKEILRGSKVTSPHEPTERNPSYANSYSFAGMPPNHPLNDMRPPPQSYVNFEMGPFKPVSPTARPPQQEETDLRRPPPSPLLTRQPYQPRRPPVTSGQSYVNIQMNPPPRAPQELSDFQRRPQPLGEQPEHLGPFLRAPLHDEIHTVPLSVQEFSAAKTSDKLNDSFEDIFHSLEVAGHDFLGSQVVEDEGERPSVPQGVNVIEQEEEYDIPDFVKTGTPPQRIVVEDFLENPPRHPFQGQHFSVEDDDDDNFPGFMATVLQRDPNFVGELFDAPPPPGLPHQEGPGLPDFDDVMGYPWQNGQALYDSFEASLVSDHKPEVFALPRSSPDQAQVRQPFEADTDTVVTVKLFLG